MVLKGDRSPGSEQAKACGSIAFRREGRYRRNFLEPASVGGMARADRAHILIRLDRSADMCTHCHLTTPRGTHDVCHACAIALRADVRRGLDAIQEYLWWSEFGRWLSQEE
jgi:hypothetical protein